MTKRLICIIVIFTVVLSALSNVSAKPGTPSKPKAFVKDYLFQKMDSIDKEDIDKIDKYYSKSSDDPVKYLIFTKQQLLQEYVLAYHNNNYEIKKVFPKIKIIRSTISSNSSTIEACLTAYIHWNAVNAIGDPIIGIKTERHLIELNKENEQWKIYSDKFMSDRGPSVECLQMTYESLNNSYKQLKKMSQESLARAKNSPATQLRLIPRSFRTEKDSRTAYNRDGAYNWAHRYWQNYSKEFVNLGDQEWEGGDCTNFVSQCLRAGGAENDTKGKNQWYYINKAGSKTSDDNYSWTWSTARGLNRILLGNNKLKEFGPKGTERVITGDSVYTNDLGQFVNSGDILQYEWSRTSNIKHSAIIVGMVLNTAQHRYEPVISTHSFDSWNLPWTKDAYKTHFVHITGIN